VTTATRDHLEPRALVDPAIVREPHDFFRRLVAEAPVWRVPGTDLVIVSSIEAATRVDDFSSNLRAILFRNDHGDPELLPFEAGDGADTLATADPPDHTTHRSAVFPGLVAKRMAALRPDVEALAEDRIRAVLPSQRVDVMQAIANAIPIRIVSKLIGFQAEDPDVLLAAAFDSTAMFAAAVPLVDIWAAMERSADVFFWIGEQLDRALERGNGGILGAVAAAVHDGSLTRDQGLVIMHTLLSAGGESTTALLGNAIHLLALDSDLQARLRNEPALVTPFIEEVLRLESPFTYHLRSATKTTELRGVEIPAGATLALFWGAANRDPAEYDRPDEVVLNRAAPRHHHGFGRGIHLCVGAPLARLESQVVLTKFLEQTEWFTLDDEAPPVRANSLMVRRFDTLPVVANRALVPR
jgi:cytochrome P450